MHIFRAADLLYLPIARKLIDCRNDISRLRGAVQLDDSIKNHLVLRIIKIRRYDKLADFADRLLAHQHAAEHRHLCCRIMRRDTVKKGTAAIPWRIKAASLRGLRCARSWVTGIIRILMHILIVMGT